jgi:hypothetical protein
MATLSTGTLDDSEALDDAHTARRLLVGTRLKVIIEKESPDYWMSPLTGEVVAVPVNTEGKNLAVLLRLDQSIFSLGLFLISLRRVSHILVVFGESYEEVRLFAQDRDILLGRKTRFPGQYKDFPELHSITGHVYFVRKAGNYMETIGKRGPFHAPFCCKCDVERS